MTEPPRPPGDGNPNDPTQPFRPYAGGDPTGSPPPPPYGSPQPPAYGSPPPSSGAGGYPPPPPPSSGAGGHGAPGYGASGYGGPGASGPGQGGPGGEYGSNEDRLWALVAHFGGAAVAFVSSGWAGWIPPLVALVAKGGQSPTVRGHAVAALNFQLLWTAVAVAITVVSTCLSVVVIGLLGFFLLIIPWLMGTIFGIIAGVKAMNGEPYRYPGAPNWVK